MDGEKSAVWVLARLSGTLGGGFGLYVLYWWIAHQASWWAFGLAGLTWILAQGAATEGIQAIRKRREDRRQSDLLMGIVLAAVRSQARRTVRGEMFRDS